MHVSTEHDISLHLVAWTTTTNLGGRRWENTQRCPITIMCDLMHSSLTGATFTQSSCNGYTAWRWKHFLPVIFTDFVILVHSPGGTRDFFMWHHVIFSRCSGATSAFWQMSPDAFSDSLWPLGTQKRYVCPTRTRLQVFSHYPPVVTNIAMERSTMSNGKTHEMSTGPFWIAM